MWFATYSQKANTAGVTGTIDEPTQQRRGAWRALLAPLAFEGYGEHMATYRAAYFRAPYFIDTVLTKPHDAGLPDDKLIEEAVAAAYRANIVCKSTIDPDEPRVTEEELRAGLLIGNWTDVTTLPAIVRSRKTAGPGSPPFQAQPRLPVRHSRALPYTQPRRRP
jgi:hypothetical protein